MPLVKKELVGLLRTKRAFWFLIAAVAVSILLPLVAWPSSASGVTESQLVVAAAGTFLLTQLTAALVIVPAFAAGAISGERERGTYEVLLATPLSPASIVLSKALAAAGYVVMLLAASAPGIILIHLLGGVTFGSIIRCEAVTLAAVILSTFICLWASMRAARTSRAIVVGVGGVILWNVGLHCMLSLLMMTYPRMAGGVLASLSYALSPHFVVLLEVFGGTGFRLAVPPSEAWVIHVAFASAVSACYLLLLLRRAANPEPSVPRGDAVEARVAARLETPRLRPFLTWFLLDMGRDDGPLANPVFRKEIQTEFFGRLWYRRRRFWALFLVFGAVVVFADFARPMDKTIMVASIAMLLVALLAPAVAASSFPREIEHGNLDFLRGTLIPLSQVLQGKFLASLYASFGIIAAAGWWMAIGGLGRPIENVTVVAPLVAFGVLVTTWLFVTAVATLVSAVSSRTTTALLGSYGAVFAWFFAIPAVLSFLEPGFGIWVAIHPSGALGALSHQELWHGGALLCFFLLHAGTIFLMLRASRRSVERLRERDP
jgi:ABC-type transport system involved in multi-copper enzyme maturation permease subunit